MLCNLMTNFSLTNGTNYSEVINIESKQDKNSWN